MKQKRGLRPEERTAKTAFRLVSELARKRGLPFPETEAALCAAGLDGNDRPNEYGLQLEQAIDYYNRFRCCAECFYFDEVLRDCEAGFQWDRALTHLEALYAGGRDRSVLCSLIGFSWFYLVEGPVVSRRYGDDPNSHALRVWKRYLDVAAREAADDPRVLFLAGYTLSLHGFWIDAAHEQTGHSYMERCARMADEPLLQQLAEHFLQNERACKYTPLQNGPAIAAALFPGDSLTDGK